MRQDDTIRLTAQDIARVAECGRLADRVSRDYARLEQLNHEQRQRELDIRYSRIANGKGSDNE